MARDLDPLAVLDVLRCHASDRTQHRHNVHPHRLRQRAGMSPDDYARPMIHTRLPSL